MLSWRKKSGIITVNFFNGSKMFIIFTFRRVGLQTDKGLWGNSIPEYNGCYLCLVTDLRNSWSCQIRGLTGQKVEKHHVCFAVSNTE